MLSPVLYWLYFPYEVRLSNNVCFVSELDTAPHDSHIAVVMPKRSGSNSPSCVSALASFTVFLQYWPLIVFVKIEFAYCDLQFSKLDTVLMKFDHFRKK